MPRYLINLTDAQARKLEAMLGGRIEIVPSWGPLDEANAEADCAVIAGLDAVFDDELPRIFHRLRTSGPRYHHGGPGGEEARLTRLRGRDPYGGRGIPQGDHWEPPIGDAPSDDHLLGGPAESRSGPLGEPSGIRVLPPGCRQ